jgi:hypothetical protein
MVVTAEGFCGSDTSGTPTMSPCSSGTSVRSSSSVVAIAALIGMMPITTPAMIALNTS